MGGRIGRPSTDRRGQARQIVSHSPEPTTTILRPGHSRRLVSVSFPHPCAEMPPIGHPLRPAAINLYKRLHRIGRSYPEPKYDFLGKLRAASAKHAHETDEKEVRKWLDLGEFVYKGEARVCTC